MTIAAELDVYIKQKQYPLVNSVLVIADGETIVERYYNRYTADSRNNIKSVWKSILSVTLGICLDKGWIRSINDPVALYLPDFAQGKHPFHRMMTIKHLLTMSSGIYWNGGVHYHCPMMAQMRMTDDWILFLSEVAMADRPGTRFVYKEWDVILLSAIIGQAAQKCAYEICAEYLYLPLGINSGPWGQSPRGVCYTVLDGVEQDSDLSARDMAKIGILMLNSGCYDGQRIVSAEYVRETLTPSAANKGYGYLWWLYGRHYRGMGFGGQEINVYPATEAQPAAIITVIQATATLRSKSYSDISEFVISKWINASNN